MRRADSGFWGVIADDLTGACDVGVPLADRGLSCRVALVPEAIGTGPGVVVLPTFSREECPDEAVRRVCAACVALRESGAAVLYKKVDSTLKGNLGAEIDATLDACDADLAVVAPAFPSQGRVYIEGYLHVVTRQALEPIHLPSMLSDQSAYGVGHVSVSVVARGASAVREALGRVRELGRCVVAVDASTDEHLATIAEAAAGLDPAPLLVGSAGLATAVAERIATSVGPAVSPVNPPPNGTRPTCGRVMVITGSTNAITRRQVDVLAAARGVLEEALHPGVAQRVRTALDTFGCAILHVEWLGKEREALVSDLLPLIAGRKVSHLVVSGGDTAWLVLSALEAKSIVLLHEFGRGIPVGRIGGGHADGLTLYTKAGGFGDEGILDAIAADLISTAGETTI